MLVLAVVVLAAVIVVVLVVFAYQVTLQMGRVILRVDALEQALSSAAAGESLPAQAASSAAAEEAGLPPGTVGVDFDLPNIWGGRSTLSAWVGRRVLLIFISPSCLHSRAVLPQLAALLADRPESGFVPIILSTGGADENRRLMEEHGIRAPVLLQDAWEVATLYQAPGTPMGYILDEYGAVMSPIAKGPAALLALATTADRLPNADLLASVGAEITPYAGDRLGRKSLPPIGLLPKTAAPPFRLPLVDGGEVTLDDYRGRVVLLVFSDPACGPCATLAPKLEEIHRWSPTLAILMVSRRDQEMNRAFVSEHDLTYPVALQHRWDTAREYGVLLTPVGYLIDEQGMIAAYVSSGVDGILAMAMAVVGVADGAAGRPGSP